MDMAGLRLVVVALTVLIFGSGLHPAAAVAADVYPIVAFHDFYNEGRSTGYFLGGFTGGQWVKPEAAAGLLPGGEHYRLYSLGGEGGDSVGSKPAKGEEGPCSDTWYVTLSPFPQKRGSLVAVGGPWNAMPRPVKLTSTEQQVYQEAAATILKSQGIANPKVNLTQVIRVDLDGDGLEEVLVSATHYETVTPGGALTPNARAGDYSLVFLRKLVQGKVVTKIITGEYYPKATEFNAPSEHRIIGVLDLNGDGIMEIVLSGRYYEGDWVDAYQVDGVKITKLLSMGCGL
jgi:hypothetical protein